MKIAETTLSMPQSRFSVSEAAMFTKWKEFFFHILTDRNLSLFCAYFDSQPNFRHYFYILTQGDTVNQAAHDFALECFFSEGSFRLRPGLKINIIKP